MVRLACQWTGQLPAGSSPSSSVLGRPKGPTCRGIALFRAVSPASSGESIDGSGRLFEQCGSLARRIRLCRPFECVPENAIAEHPLVDGEIALEHATVSAEVMHASLDMWLPCRCKLRRRRRALSLVKIEAGHPHSKTTELDVDVFAGGKCVAMLFRHSSNHLLKAVPRTVRCPKGRQHDRQRLSYWGTPARPRSLRRAAGST